MITIKECAEISHDSYGSGLYIKKTVNKNEPMTPSYTGLARVTDVSSSMSLNNHFYAQLYIKFYDGVATDAIVAIRGTIFNDWTNDGEDVLSWISDTLGDGHHGMAPEPFTSMAQQFIWDAIHYNDEHFPHLIGIYLTGHSLGGAIAQLCLLNGAFTPQVITFNAPGIGHLVSERRKEMAAGKIYNINARYGIINKIGQAVGKIYLIDIPQMENEAKALFTHFDKKTFLESVTHYQQLHQQGWLGLSGSLAGANSSGDIEFATALAERLDSYIKAEQGLADAPTTKQQYLYCQNEHEMKHWYQLETLLKLKACEQTSLLQDCYQIIVAQHSITNMLNALQNQPYMGFSEQATSALAMQHA